MEYKWYDIRKKIISACKKTFTEQGVIISSADIESATDLFDRVVSYHLNYPAVGNLQQDLQHSLQQVFVNNIGVSADLRNVLNLMDAYLKKILYMAGIKTQVELSQPHISLKPLLQLSAASSTFCSINHKIEESSISRYDKDPTGAYIFCKVYLSRNKVHESIEMDTEDVYRELRYAMAAYILVTNHLKSPLLSLHPDVESTVRIDLSEINETGYVYDFINYGNTSNKIKNRIVESFILNYVYKTNSAVSIEKLADEVVAFSRQSLNTNSVKSIIGRLIPDKLQKVNTSKKEVYLVETEKKRIEDALSSYKVLVERLVLEIENLLDGYGLKEKTQNVYKRLKKFFEDNCLSIIKILNEDDGVPSIDRSEDYIEDFKRFLKSIGCVEEKKNELFKGLLQICAMNDVLIKISLGKNFTSISNPESLSSGFKQREKQVYLDTQLLLYALCDYDYFNPYNGSPSFVIVKSLMNLARQNPNIKLVASDQYVNEAAYQLKRAVQLIPFDDIYHDSPIKLSDNVFYSYYYYLKDNNQLNEGIDNLSDFLWDMFEVSYDDILGGSFENKIYSYIVSILEDDCGIIVESIPSYSQSEISNSEKVFTTALLSRGDSRSPVAAHKDAVMGLHLFSIAVKATSEPFFLSWDRSFSVYRKDYIKQYYRGSMSWHLFSPAKFVNHLNLLDMKIDVDVLTEDLISIIEDEDTAQNTKNVLDSIQKLLDKSNITSRKKRKAFTEIIFNETEFPNDTTIPEEKKLKKTNDFAQAFDKLLTMMQTGDYHLSDFLNFFDNENTFKEIVSSLSKRLNNNSPDNCATVVFEQLKTKIVENTPEK